MVNLTAKELKIITLLAAGMTNKEIARDLGNSYETTKVQVYAIYAKVGCRNRVECAVWWIRLQREEARMRTLTGREFQVYMLVCESAKDDRQIAEILGISLNTLKTTKRHVLSKLGFENSLKMLVAHHLR